MSEQEVYDHLAEWYGMRGLPQIEHIDPMVCFPFGEGGDLP